MNSELTCAIYTRDVYDKICKEDINLYCESYNITIDANGEFVYNNLLDLCSYYEQEFLATHPQADFKTAKFVVVDKEYFKWLKANKKKHSSDEMAKYVSTMPNEKAESLFKKYNLQTNYFLYYLPIGFVPDVAMSISKDITGFLQNSLTKYFTRFIDKKNICVFDKLIDCEAVRVLTPSLFLAGKEYFEGKAEAPVVPSAFIPPSSHIKAEEGDVYLIPVMVRNPNVNYIVDLVKMRDAARYINNYNSFLHKLEEDFMESIEDVEMSDKEFQSAVIKLCKEIDPTVISSAVLIKNNEYSSYFFDLLYFSISNIYWFRNFNKNADKIYFPKMSEPHNALDEIAAYLMQLEFDDLDDWDNDEGI